MVVSRGCSSRSTTVSPLRPLTVTGAISCARKAWEAAAFCWERKAKASWSWRETWYCSATFSAVSGIESVPCIVRIRLFTKRQPMVVS